ncbi:shikimate dehydrogenase [Microbacterium sp. No. 7]|uniref:shikimate dehydrogenase n=1 Tax=Microbacterium sp. No. 7 TaxID=1714373 RepID=UPI0006CF3DF2|nr:shikimate dehydrogenase [Microbacterium sp. No. 7]
MGPDRLEVWGDPISHSLSPALHAAAYRRLGRGWCYGRRRVDEASFPRELASLDASYRGLSLTMPLKGVAHAAAATRDDRAELTGAVNTLLLTGPERRGFNTDVGGIVRALAEEGVTEAERARIVGAGATATSALVALAEMGARDVEVAARRPEAVVPLVALGERLNVVVHAAPLAAGPFGPRDVTIATLPGDAPLDPAVADALAGGEHAGGLLMDVVYGHWPTVLSSAWERAGLRAVSGAGMLLHQAVLQIRVFSTGDVHAPLPDEDDVLAEMRRALVGG